MNFVNFHGYRITSADFLDRISEISDDVCSLRTNLECLDIFSSIIPSKNKVLLTESPKSMKVNFTKQKKQFGIKIPNIFGRGEIFEMELVIDQNAGVGPSTADKKSAANGAHKDSLSKEGSIKSDPSLKEDSSTHGLLEKWIAPNMAGLLSSVTLFNLEVVKPTVGFGGIFKNKLKVSQSSFDLNDRAMKAQQVEISTAYCTSQFKVGLEKVNDVIVCSKSYVGKILGLQMYVKTGVADKMDSFLACQQKADQQGTLASCASAVANKVTSNGFLKFILGKRFCLSYKNVFAESTFQIGKIFGKTNLSEKFFLGERKPQHMSEGSMPFNFLGINGYRKNSIVPIIQNKKTGGNSCIQITNRLGYTTKFNKNVVEVYGFADICSNSLEGLTECLQIMKMDDSSCLGKSVGVGVKIKDGMSLVYSIPLTNNLETERFAIGMDMKI